MATRNQKGRGEPELVERLDALAARTNRSRDAYLRMALWAALPSLERMHWEQVAADFEELAIKDAFEEIALGLMKDALKNDRNARALTLAASKQPGRTPGPGQSPCRTSATRHMAGLTGALIYRYDCVILGVFQRPIHRRASDPKLSRQGCFRLPRQRALLNLCYLLRV